MGVAAVDSRGWRRDRVYIYDWVMNMIRTTVLVACALAGLISKADAQSWLYPIDVTPGPDGSVLIADRTLPGIWSLKDGQSTVLVQASKKFRTPLNAVRCLYTSTDGGIF